MIMNQADKEANRFIKMRHKRVSVPIPTGHAFRLDGFLSAHECEYFPVSLLPNADSNISYLMYFQCPH